MNKDLNELGEKTLETVYGGPIREENLPEKFKQIKKDDELSPEALGAVYGGPIKLENLPEGTYVDKNQNLETKEGPNVLK